MGIFDKAKDRLERDNSGGWDRDYIKYIRKSILDRIIEIPLQERCISLSYRRYHLPAHVIKNINYQLGLDSLNNLPKDAILPENHPLSGAQKIAFLYKLKIGLKLEISSVKDWENLNPDEREFTLSFLPIAYHYKRFEGAYNFGGGLSRDSVPPSLVIFDNKGIYEEKPEFMKIKKQMIYFRPEVDWPKKFYMGIQGLRIQDLGFGNDWQDEAAYNG